MDGIRNKSKYIYHYSPKIEHLELEQCQVSTTLYICKGICIVRQRSSCKVHDTMIWYQKTTNKYVTDLARGPLNDVITMPQPNAMLWSLKGCKD